MLKFANAGHGNMIAVDKVVAIISPNSSPAKRLKDEAKEAGRMLDITMGRRTRAIIVTVANQVILSAVQVETLAARFQLEPDKPVDMPENVLKLNPACPA